MQSPCAEVVLLCCVQPTQSDALAVLADVAGSAREEMEVAGQLQVLATLNSCQALQRLCGTQ